jgi:hypothetical protein
LLGTVDHVAANLRASRLGSLASAANIAAETISTRAPLSRTMYAVSSAWSLELIGV